MQIERRRTFPVDAATLLAALTSQAFYDARHAMSGITQYRYDAFGPSERGLVIRIVRELEFKSQNMPSFARRFVGQSATLTTEFVWTKTDEQPYRAEYHFTMGRIPVQVRGSMILHDDDDHDDEDHDDDDAHKGAGQAVQALKAEILSSVPLIGRKLEELVAAQLDKGLESDYRATVKYLQESV